MEYPSDDFYNTHTLIFNRNPQVKSLIPRTPEGKQNPTRVTSNKPMYNGPVYLPMHICDMLSEEAKKELDKYNQEKKTSHQSNSNRMAKSTGKIMEMMILQRTLNLILTITIWRTHITCKTQILKS